MVICKFGITLSVYKSILYKTLWKWNHFWFFRKLIYELVVILTHALK